MTQHGQPLPGGPRPWLGPWGPLNRRPIHNRPRTGWEEGWGRGALHPHGPSPHVHSAPRKMRRERGCMRTGDQSGSGYSAAPTSC